jgi:CDGSH-type Zn-finger protein
MGRGAGNDEMRKPAPARRSAPIIPRGVNWHNLPARVAARPALQEMHMAMKITMNSKGPLRLEGEFEICDPRGNKFGLAGRTLASLCRCGHSASNPFCDEVHRTAGFQDQVQARDLPPPATKP